MYMPVGCLSAGQPASIAVPNVMVCYGSTCPQPCCGYSARAVCLAKLSSAASAKTQPWQSRTRRMNEALMTVYHDCTSVCEFRPLLCFCSQHMSRSKFFFLGLICRFDIVTPTQRSETSSRSQGGGSVMASNSSSAASAQVASRSRNRTAVCEY